MSEIEPGSADWVETKTFDGARVAALVQSMRRLLLAVGADSTQFMSAFVTIFGEGSTEVPDDLFEKDLALVCDSIRRVRAYAQSRRANKS